MRFWQVKLQLEGKGELESELSDCCSCCSCYCYCCYCCCWSINNPLCKGLSHCSFTYLKCTLCFLHTQFAINLKQLCCPPCKRTEDPSRSAKKKTTTKNRRKKKHFAVKWHVACQPQHFQLECYAIMGGIFMHGLKVAASRVDRSAFACLALELYKTKLSRFRIQMLISNSLQTHPNGKCYFPITTWSS